MPKVRTEMIAYANDGTCQDLVPVEIHVDAAGEFYCYPREDLAEYLRSNPAFAKQHNVRTGGHRKRLDVVTASTLAALVQGLQATLKEVSSPQVVEELVIRYNLESRVSFAELPDGTIVPSGKWPSAEWATDKAYGELHATHRIRGGMQMTVGANAYRKIIKTFPTGKQATKYLFYYGTDEEGQPLEHHSIAHPAAILNSWTGFALDEFCHYKEMPYTDAAAIWFHQLMLGMATLQRKIQTMLAKEQEFIKFVNTSGVPLLPTKQ